MSFEPTLDDSFVLAPTVQIENEAEKISNKPVKRPHNAYNLFFIEHKQIERDNHPKLTGNEISQLIGKIWNEMSEDEKRPYKERAKIIHEQFKEENPNYHYQKASEKIKKKRIHPDIIPRDTFNFNTPNHPNLNMNLSATLEIQLKNMFSSLGQKIVLRYFEQNKTDMDVMIKNSQTNISESIDNVINDIDTHVLNQ